jgi:hypothetical protein
MEVNPTRTNNSKRSDSVMLVDILRGKTLF